MTPDVQRSVRFAHVALWTRDLDAAAVFWATYFGAQVGEPYYSARRPGFVSRFATLPGEDMQIELMSAPWISDSAQDAVGWTHIALKLGSEAAVDELASRCDAAGLLASAPRMTGDGFYEAVVKMPDGTPLEITA